MFNFIICNTDFERNTHFAEHDMRTLTRKQFDILSVLAESGAALSQRDMQGKTGMSLGTVNRTFKELCDLGYVLEGTISPAGLDALEPYRVKRAIFIAAGFGSRMVPITLNTPKPLVRVNGRRIIDTLLDAVVAAGIEEIYIVRGYLKENFDQLLYKYPSIKFIDNDMFNEANNISSALLAKDLLCNAYLFEADLLLSNPALIKKYCYSSNFLGIPMERSDDWCFQVKNGIITELNVGGTNCWQEVGISYWDEEAGKKLAEHIPMAFEVPGGRELYWEQVPLVKFKGEYKVEVRECTLDDIVEIDSFKELKAIDKAYDI